MTTTKRISEGIVQEFGGKTTYEFVLRTKWVDRLDTNFVDSCKIEMELFFNRLFRDMVKRYSRGNKVLGWFFWEKQSVLHCHCLVGFDPKFTRFDFLQRWRSRRGIWLRGFRCIDRAWLGENEVEPRLVEYCLKECLESDSVCSDYGRVVVWRDGRMPGHVQKYIESGQVEQNMLV